MRRLALHASALSDTEYDFFTKSLCQIADDDQILANDPKSDSHFENISIGVREARAWFRGRYSHLSASTIDGILKFFSPSLSQGDLISGIQFFAALRLVIHAENGKEIDRSFAFVQVEPFERTTSPVQKLAIDSRPPSPPIRLPHAPMYTDLSILPSATSSFYADSLINRPFPLTDAQQYHHQLPLHHPYQGSESSKSFSQPPFTHGPLHSENGSVTNLPPLPPRRHLPALSQFPAPPRRIGTGTSRIDRSLSPSTRSSGSTSAFPIAAKPTQHFTSTLIKQSLQASKVAQSMKKAEEQLEKERVMQVLKSSSTVSGASPLAGASVVGSSVVIGTNIHNQHQHQYPSLGPFAGSRPSRLGQKYFAASSISSGSDGNSRPPPLPRRRSVRATPSQQPSPPLSECSLEQVALASPPRHHLSRDTSEHGDANPKSRSPNPFGANIADHHPLPPDPPPTHPDRKGYYVGYQQLPPSPEQPSEARSLPHSQEVGNFEAVYGSISASPDTSVPNSSHHAPSTISDAIPDSPMTRASHSFTQTSSALLPPPMRKRRSESVQLRDKDTSAEPNVTSRSGTGTHAKPPSNHVGHRKSSLSLSSAPSFISYTQTPFNLTTENKTWRSSSESSTTAAGSTTNATSTSSSTMGSNVQRTIEALHSIHGQLQPKLDKARYKAEAGLSRRGYMRGTVRSSAEDFPGAAAEELEEKEGLTGEYTSRKGRSGWMDKYMNGSAGTPVGGRREPSEVVNDSDEPSSDEQDKLMSSEKAVNANIPDQPVDSFSNPQQRLPRNVFDDSPERDGEDEDVGRLSRELENSSLQRGWTPF